MRAQFLLAAALCACSPAGPSAPPTADDMALSQDDGPPAIMDLVGRIVGLDQQPLAGVAVSLCQTSCRETVTGAQGQFAFAEVATSFYTLRARKTGDREYAELDFPLYLQRGANPRLLPLVLPKVGAGAPVATGAQTFTIDGALALSLSGADLAFPEGAPTGRLGGVRIPEGLFPNFCVPSARVLAMWAFSPTGVLSASPVGVALGDGMGLPAGTNVSLIEIDPMDGRPAVVSGGIVSQDGKSIRTALGQGLRRLSWLLVAVLQGGA